MRCPAVRGRTEPTPLRAQCPTRADGREQAHRPNQAFRHRCSSRRDAQEGPCGEHSQHLPRDLRPFGRWLLDNGYVKRNPASHLKNAKIAPDRSKRKPLTSDQLKQVIEKAERRHPCDGMTVSLLFWTGCRQSEIRGLKWGDVNLQDLTLEVYRPKVKKSLTCPIPAQLAEDLTKWQAWVEGRYGPIQPEWYVVPARFHRGFVNGIPQKKSRRTGRSTSPSLRGRSPGPSSACSYRSA